MRVITYYIRLILLMLLMQIIHPALICADDSLSRFDYLSRELDASSYTQRQRSLGLIDSLYLLAEQSPDSSLLISRCIYAETLLSYRQNIVDSTRINRIKARIDKEPTIEEELYLFSSLSLSLFTLEDYVESYTAGLRALETAKQLNDSLVIGRTLNTLGTIYNNAQLYGVAESYYQEALNYLHNERFMKDYCMIKGNLYTSYYSRDDYPDKESLIDLQKENIAILEESGNTSALLLHYTNLGAYYMDMGNSEDFHHCQMKAIELCEDNPYIYSIILINLATHYLSNGENDIALDYYLQVQDTWEKGHSFRLLAFVYNQLSIVYERKGDIDRALYYSRKGQDASQKFYRNDKLIETHRKYLAATIEGAEDKLRLAKIQIDLKNQQSILFKVVFVVVALLIIFILVVVWLERRNMKQRLLIRTAEAKELASNLEKEQALQKIQTLQLENKLREITSYSLLVSSKNQAFHQIANLLPKMVPEDKLVKQEIKTIVDENLQTDKAWNEFMMHFEQVHPHFFDALRAICPSISPTDLRLAAYIRIGLSTKEIAQILNNTPQSIKISRHRLRKKLNLDKDDKLENLIQNI